MEVSDLSNVVLLSGSHETRDEGMCVMEAVAWAAGEPHSDRPQCACPALAAYARGLNDRYWPGPDCGVALRTEVLRPVILALVGTRSSDEVYQRRGFFFADRAVRELAPMAIDSRADRWALGKRPEVASLLRDVALKMRAVPEIVDKASATAARDILGGLRDALWEQSYAAAAASAVASAVAAAAVAAAAADAADAAAYAADAAAYAVDAAASAVAAAYAVAARIPILRRAAEILVEAAQIKEKNDDK